MISKIKQALAITEKSEEFHLGATIMMIVLILTFIGTSFYIMLTNMA